MGLLKKFIERMRSNKEAEKEEESRQSMMERIAAKRLSANERELMEWQEKDRQASIKKALEHYHRIRQEKLWSGRDGNPAYVKNVIKGQKELYKNNKNIFNGKTKFFKQKDLFFGGGR